MFATASFRSRYGGALAPARSPARIFQRIAIRIADLPGTPGASLRQIQRKWANAVQQTPRASCSTGSASNRAARPCSAGVRLSNRATSWNTTDLKALITGREPIQGFGALRLPQVVTASRSLRERCGSMSALPSRIAA